MADYSSSHSSLGQRVASVLRSSTDLQIHAYIYVQTTHVPARRVVFDTSPNVVDNFRAKREGTQRQGCLETETKWLDATVYVVVVPSRALCA